MKRRIVLFFLVGLAAASLAAAQENDSAALSLGELVNALMENDTDIRSNRITVRREELGYRQTVGEADPGLSLNLSPYGVDMRRAELDPTVPANRDITTHSFGAGIQYDQLLPTAGTLSLSLRDRFDVSQVAEEGMLPEEEQVSQSPELSLSVRQPVFVNGRFIDMRLFDATRKISKLQYEAAESRFYSAVNNRIATAANSYVQLLGLRDQVAALQASRKAREIELEQVRISREQGRSSQQQLLSLQVALNSLDEQLLSLRYSISEAERSLARAASLPLSEVTGTFAELPEVPMPEAAIPQLVDQAMAENAQLQALRLEAERARLQRIQAGREHGASLQMSLNLQPRYGDERSADQDFGSAFEDYRNDGSGIDWSARIDLTIPLSERRERELTRESSNLSVEQRGLDLENLRGQVESSIENRVRRDEILARRIELLQSDTAYRERLLENEERRRELDTATELDVQRVRAELVRKENAVRQAVRERFLNALALYSLLGRRLDTLPAVSP